jgi:hypothetical protein
MDAIAADGAEPKLPAMRSTISLSASDLPMNNPASEIAISRAGAIENRM